MKKYTFLCFLLISFFTLISEAKSTAWSQTSHFFKKIVKVSKGWINGEEGVKEQREPASSLKNEKKTSKALLKEALQENYDEEKQIGSSLGEAISDTKRLKNEIHRDLAKIKQNEDSNIQTRKKKVSFDDLDIKISDRKEEVMEKR